MDSRPDLPPAAVRLRTLPHPPKGYTEHAAIVGTDDVEIRVLVRGASEVERVEIADFLDGFMRRRWARAADDVGPAVPLPPPAIRRAHLSLHR